MALEQTVRRLAIVGTAGIMALTAACSGSDSQVADATNEPLQIFMSAGVTGLLAPSQKAVERGIRAKIETLNANGGINGRKIELTVEDNQSDPTRGVTLVQAALNGDKRPDLVIPGVSSNEMLAVAPLLARSKVVGVGAASSAVMNDITKYPYFFSQTATQQGILAVVAAKLAKEGTVKKVALVAPNDALGDAVGVPLKTELSKVGIATTDTRFPADGVDLSPAFQKAMDGNPDLIFMEGAGNQAALLLSGRVKAGAENVPTLAGGTVATQPLLSLAKGTNQLDNVSIVMLPAQHFIPPADRSEVLKEFLAVVKAQGPLVSPLNTYAAGWDIVALWADAVATIDGEVTSEKINEAMKHIPASAPRLMFQKVFTPTNNYVQPTEGDFVIGIPTAVTDGMFEYK